MAMMGDCVDYGPSKESILKKRIERKNLKYKILLEDHKILKQKIKYFIKILNRIEILRSSDQIDTFSDLSTLNEIQESLKDELRYLIDKD
jgi:hypothetical protein